jgi:hypothetical protein
MTVCDTLHSKVEATLGPDPDHKCLSDQHDRGKIIANRRYRGFPLVYLWYIFVYQWGISAGQLFLRMIFLNCSYYGARSLTGAQSCGIVAM